MAHLARLALVAAAALQAGSSQGGADAAFQTRVNEAIEKGAAWLRKAQKPNGTWSDRHSGKFESGVAALGFLTLVKSGVGESDPAVQRSIKYFDDYRAFEKVYSTGVLLLAWESLKRGSVDKPKAEAAAKWLIEHRDPATKLWAYPDGEVDLSNTQYAILGLHAASRMGIPIPQQFLFESLQAVAKRQQKESSFTYKDPNDIGTGSMTTAAIFALRVGALELKGFAPYEAVRLDWETREKAAFDWLEKHYRVDANPAGFSGKGGMRSWHFYYLYGLERACTIASRPKIGKHSWYREGADLLLEQQRAGGDWGDNMVDTCFALLFLKRATQTWSPTPMPAVDTAASPPPDESAKRPPAPKPEVPFIQSWHVIGPFLTKRSEPFGKDEIGEASVKTAKEDEAPAGSNKRWKKVETKDPVLVLDKVLPPFDGAFAYAFATVKTKKELDAILWIGHDDCARAWVNGKLVYENETYGEAASADAYFVRVRLQAGRNAFLVKVYDSGYDCGVVARFATPEGGPVD